MARATWSGFLEFRAGERPRGPLHRHDRPDHPLQSAPQGHVESRPLQEGRRGDRRGALDRGHRQRLSARWRRVHRGHPRGDGRGGARQVRTDRDPGLRRSRRDRPDILSPDLLPRSEGQGRRPRLHAVVARPCARPRRSASRRSCCATRSTSSPSARPRRCSCSRRCTSRTRSAIPKKSSTRCRRSVNAEHPRTVDRQEAHRVTDRRVGPESLQEHLSRAHRRARSRRSAQATRSSSAPSDRPKSNVIDLMSALQASIDRLDEATDARSAAKAARPRRARASRSSAHRERRGLDAMTQGRTARRARASSRST